MMCENCRNEIATTHIKTTINGLIKQYHLCSNCADKLGFNEFDVFSINNLWGSLIEKKSKITTSSKKCSGCGMTFEDFIKNGKIGCEECYQSFKEEIIPILLKIQGKDKHKGRILKSDNAKKSDDETELKNLEEALKTAIIKEEYEKAAELRDAIRAKKGEHND